METIDQILHVRRASARIHDDHPDLKLFHADGLKMAKAAILFPVIATETADFMRSLNESPSWLSLHDLITFDDDQKRLEKPTSIQLIDSLFASKKGMNQELTQRLFPLTQLPEVLVHCQGRSEHYLSQCSFKKSFRSADAVNQLTSCWVDLDYYKPSVDSRIAEDLDDDALAIHLIIDRCLEGVSGRSFMPTQIIRSGRGLYVKWIFNSFLPQPASARWRHCQNRLVKLFTDLGADPSATDAARFLRIIGSRNSKSGTVTKIILTGKPIYFDELADAVLLRQRANQTDREATKQLATQYKVARKGKTDAHKRYSGPGRGWPSTVADEVLKLVQMRGLGIRGHMEQATFIIMNFRLMGDLVKSKEDFDQNVTELANGMGADVRQLIGQVKNLWTRHVAGKSSYRLSKEKIISRLAISTEELKHLRCLSKPAGAAWTERDAAKTRREKRPVLHQRARLLERSGMPLKDIAAQLNIATRTVKRWLEQTR